MLFKPYRNNIYTSHIVPLMSNMPDASETPSMYQGSVLPPREITVHILDPRAANPEADENDRQE